MMNEKLVEKNAIKVLVVVCQMNLGGLECRLMDIIKNIDYQRVHMDIFTYRLFPGKQDEVAVKYGTKIYYNPPLTIKNMFWYIGYFKKFLNTHPEYKIIHVHQGAWCSVFCKAACLAGVPVRIAHARTAISTINAKSMLKNIIKLPARKYATHYFAVSKLAGEWLFGKANADLGKVHIWKNAINCQNFRFDPVVRKETREKLEIQEKKIIMHVGNFTPPKNQLFLLDIMALLKEQDPDYILIFVGEERNAGLQHKAQIIAENKGISQYIRFLGNRNDVNKLLQAADIFCFPSIYEGLPGAVLEAQAAGLPCVISASIAEEVKILNTTKMLPLEAGAEVWKREIERSLYVERRDTFDEMVHAGFDIKELTEKLTKFYEEVGRT